MKVGIIGCGNISDIYLKNSSQFEEFTIVACADVDQQKANEKVHLYKIPAALTPDELLADREIELVINLTPPGVHAEICLGALNNGKHVYTEKPLAVSVEDGRKIIETAKAKGLLVGSAPDTFLGAGLQTCQYLIEQGVIGQPIAATAFMLKPGPELWHPNPDFLYQSGGGPLFDMGPYYLTALIQLLGPVNSVAAAGKISSPERMVHSGERKGEKFPVETPTHLSGTLSFKKGAIATMVMSFDVWGTETPFIEIYGSEGTLSVPDPNTFGGPVRIKKPGEAQWRDMPLLQGYEENMRGIGAADMVSAILRGTRHRANGELAFHVLETMHAFHLSSLTETHVKVESTCNPAPLLSDENTLSV